MAQTKRSHRAFALIGALLFFVTSAGASALVIWQATRQNGQQDTSTAQQTDTCQISPVANVETLPPPEIVKIQGDVTKLESTDLTVGNGEAAKAGDCLVTKYYGTAATTGEKFDENFTGNEGLKFRLGAGNVIQGWDEGLIGMKVGSTRRLVIPSELAYGASGSCKTYDQNSQPDPTTGEQKCLEYTIQPNADLVFIVKLVKIEK